MTKLLGPQTTNKTILLFGGDNMPDTNRFNKKCKFLIPDGNFYLCAATESDRIKNCISFCPTECKKFQSKKGKTAEDSSVIEGGSNGSLET